jgi:UTP--glucose-1-phosphate uridylyltransferase
MLPVGRRLALEHIVDELSAAGMRRVVFVISPAKEALIRRHFGERDASGVTFGYALQPEMRGLGDAILRVAPLVEGSPFVVALGDAVLEEPVVGGLTRRLVDIWAAEKATIGLAVQRVARERISRYGVVRPAPGAAPGAAFLVITDIVEKPAPDEAPSDLAAAARYVLAPEALAVLRDTAPAANGEVQLTDAIRTLLRGGRRGVAVPMAAGEARHDLGGLDSYFRAFAAFALTDEQHGADLTRWLAGRVCRPATPEENPVE